MAVTTQYSRSSRADCIYDKQIQYAFFCTLYTKA